MCLLWGRGSARPPHTWAADSQHNPVCQGTMWHDRTTIAGLQGLCSMDVCPEDREDRGWVWGSRGIRELGVPAPREDAFSHGMATGRRHCWPIGLLWESAQGAAVRAPARAKQRRSAGPQGQARLPSWLLRGKETAPNPTVEGRPRQHPVALVLPCRCTTCPLGAHVPGA